MRRSFGTKVAFLAGREKKYRHRNLALNCLSCWLTSLGEWMKFKFKVSYPHEKKENSGIRGQRMERERETLSSSIKLKRWTETPIWHLMRGSLPMALHMRPSGSPWTDMWMTCASPKLWFLFVCSSAELGLACYNPLSGYPSWIPRVWQRPPGSSRWTNHPQGQNTMWSSA